MTRPSTQSACCETGCCESSRAESAWCPPGCCEEVESIRSRPLLDRQERRRLALLFKVLANDTRLRLLHLLIKSGERSVNDLADAMEMKPQAVSNQLQRLALQQIVESRRDGNSIFYRVVDPCCTLLLDYGLCLQERTPTGAKRKRVASG